MEGKRQLLMDKYLQVLGGATGKEIDNIRAKMAWVLTEELFNEGMNIPLSKNDLDELLNVAFLEQFPFCENIAITEKDSENIVITVMDCHLKIANDSFESNEGYSLCPVDPFLIFSLSRGLSRNIWLVDVKPSENGCVMEFSLSNQCAVRKPE